MRFPFDSYIDFYLRSLSPSEIVRSTALSIGVILLLHKFHHVAVVRHGGSYKKTLLYFILKILQRAPLSKGLIDKEKSKVLDKVKHSVTANIDTQGEDVLVRIPPKGADPKGLLDKMKRWSDVEAKHWECGKVSGGVYHGGRELLDTLTKAYGLFALSNPLHPEVFPFVRKMEAEVVRMTISMFNGDGECCGTMTAGGTESILMALKAYRDYAKQEKGIDRPELIIPASAHAAFEKGCHYFGIRAVKTKVDAKTFRADVGDIERNINKNTIAIVGSCPSFPQGMMDNIPKMGQLALSHGVGLHVDCCLGGFLMPWLRRCGFPPPYEFDFKVVGVTSISADTHKYGYAPKGSSVVMYRNSELRHYQYFVSADWMGGIYASPSMPGSRPGGLIAATWAAMVINGEENYMKCAMEIMKTAREISAGIPLIDGLTVLGTPDMSVIAFASSDSAVNIYKVNEAMTGLGWNLNNLQHPPSLHLCCTYIHRGCSQTFLSDLRSSVKDVRENPQKYKNGSAAIYGMAGSIPDTSLVDDIAKGYIDALFIP